ncbi:MAG TPA: TauD/TfdA family dioxygenase [Acidimicrobiales bacterium]|nr:TauD/TfdA family dioxygenase [Acidimicrobiales bacterium]
MTTLSIQKLSETVGAEVIGLEPGRLLTDDSLAEGILSALEVHGVLVFRDLRLDPETQVSFCRRIGEVELFTGSHPVQGIFRVTLDPSKNPAADYLRGTFDWHIDGCTPVRDEFPQMATVLTACVVAEKGGETEFAGTYVAFDDLGAAEKKSLEPLRVMHSLEASQRLVTPDPTPEQLAAWRQRPGREHPLIWNHKSGRRSLVIGATTDHVIGMSREDGRALLDDLLKRSTRPERVYRHHWSVGDTVIWDNRGVLHRVEPYDLSSPREMLRTTLLGDEPIQ